MANPKYSADDWRAIPFAPDYEVNPFGEIRRAAEKPAYLCGKHLRHKFRHDGYPEVTLYVGGKPRFFRVHQVVCIVFHGGRPVGKDEVGHIDGDRGNCHASNLRWVTKAENYADRNRHGTHNKGERNGAAKIDPLKVQAIHILSERMPSRKVAAVLGISKSQVGNILRGEAWT